MDYFDFLKLQAENEARIETLCKKHYREMRIGFLVLMIVCTLFLITLFLVY